MVELSIQMDNYLQKFRYFKSNQILFKVRPSRLFSITATKYKEILGNPSPEIRKRPPTENNSNFRKTE